MTVIVRLIHLRDGKPLGDFEYAAVPPAGAGVAVLEREWEEYVVESVQFWPRNETFPDEQPRVVAFVKYRGEIS